VPIIVVGNLTVGGVGKTPLVIALAQYFTAQGLRVGIVSRGYGAHIRKFPHCVCEEDAAWLVGDEPKLLALKTQCPVVIAPNRLQAVQYLLQHHQSQLIISDDGLQHYAMPRQIEIAVIDGVRGLGSGMCLPAGPLRESASRLQQVDFIVVNGAQTVHTPYGNSYHMIMQADLPHSFKGQSLAWDEIEMPCSAVAGMGHPERFFALLSQLGVVFQPYKFADHHEFTPEDLACLQKPVIMTEKDAVKCCAFATDAMYYLPVEAKLSDEFWTKIWSQIKAHVHN
jgi:tetraacyldisaccharide 4'-kinase